MSGCTCTYSFPSRQTGAALLAFSLLLIVGTSYFLLKELNVNFIQLKQQQETRDVLEQAKQALIGYSVSYPDHHPGMGPGILPCPDRNKDGSAVANCSFSGQTTIGRFPWRTMDLPQPRDSHGETLWYVVSDNFRTPPVGAINSETPGDLSVDNITDIVAVIIAPGAPVGAQDRDPAETDVLNEISNYLEGDNANLDALFVSIAADDFNDQIIFITRQELMFAVEKRVLGEVFQTLDTYRTDHSAYPWLSPFTDPAASAFRAQLDDTASPKTGWQGHLPFHWINDPLSITNDPGGVVNRNPFNTALFINWQIDNGTVTSTGNANTPTPDEDCVRADDCNDTNDTYMGPITGPLTVDEASGECQWMSTDSTDPIADPLPKDYLNCAGSSIVTGTHTETHDVLDLLGIPILSVDVTYQITREYNLTLEYRDSDGAGVAAPSATQFRTRTLDINGDGTSLGEVQNVIVTLEDTYTHTTDLSGYEPSSFSPSLFDGTRTSELRFTPGDYIDGNISVSNIIYDVDIENEEIPEWFVLNEWHRLIYVAYAEVEDIPGGSTSCSTDVADPNYPCLTINGAGTPNNNSRGIIISAGNIIATIPQDRSSSPDITQYFEEQNSDQDQVYQASSLYDLRAALESANPVNDQVKVLATP